MIVSGIFFLVRQQLLHKQVIDPIQLLVAVQRGQLLLSIHHDGLQDHQTQILLVGLILLHSGEERHIGLAVQLQRVDILQFKFIAFLIRQRDEIRAEIFAHRHCLLFDRIGVCGIVPYLLLKCKPRRHDFFRGRDEKVAKTKVRRNYMLAFWQKIVKRRGF